jgi:hypothetical protein
MTYSEILDNLRRIVLIVIRFDSTDINRNKNIDEIMILLKHNEKDKYAPSIRQIAETLRNVNSISKYIQNISNNNNNNNSIPRDISSDSSNTSINELLYRIDREIDQYKFGLVPRILNLSDDEEVSLALMVFEKHYGNFTYLCNSENRQVYLFENIIYNGLADLLTAIADLYQVIQRKMDMEPKKSFQEEIIQILKHWWLPYDN